MFSRRASARLSPTVSWRRQSLGVFTHRSVDACSASACGAEGQSMEGWRRASWYREEPEGGKPESLSRTPRPAGIEMEESFAVFRQNQQAERWG